nr:MAG TPA: hypothetical protein [Caudoviricetes sp.]
MPPPEAIQLAPSATHNQCAPAASATAAGACSTRANHHARPLRLHHSSFGLGTSIHDMGKRHFRPFKI